MAQGRGAQGMRDVLLILRGIGGSTGLSTGTRQDDADTGTGGPGVR